ncbi:MAG: hypothetical protein ABIK26_07485, partial [Candidatus Omnitrophota bacterium]
SDGIGCNWNRKAFHKNPQKVTSHNTEYLVPLRSTQIAIATSDIRIRYTKYAFLFWAIAQLF